uniref:Uncharacterized protein n=1 Tax=Oryza nivara TaxID=4536 RepID=A0A679BCF1_ORYNI|nr:hypothetical protein [Oryza sativa f. spontanea]
MDEVGRRWTFSRANEGYTGCGPVVEMSYGRGSGTEAPSSSAATQSKSAKGSTRDKSGEEKIPSATGDQAKQSRVEKLC